MFIAGMLFACYQTPEKASFDSKDQNEAIAENKVETRMAIKGMVCAMGCAKFIEEKVADIDGIVSSEVDFETKEALFKFDDSSLTAEEIKDYISTIHDGQYSAEIIKEEKREKQDIPTEDIGEEDEDLGSVHQKVNFSFPELFTFFLEQI